MPVLLDPVHAASWLEQAEPQEILRWAVVTLPRFAVSSSFGADSAVLLHMVAELDPSVPVLFSDTGLHFEATLAYRDELAAHLGLRDVRTLVPAKSLDEQAREDGPGLWERDPDGCCARRKLAPLDDALAGFDGWASGLRRDQTLVRSVSPVVQAVRRGGRELVKLAPLARWRASDVEGYLTRHGLPRHPMVAAGYRSIGCRPCTRPVRLSEDDRAGRWAGTPKTECGLHL